MKKILIVVPHMDDEVLSFGGLIQKSLMKGHNITVQVMTAGGPCSNASTAVRVQEYTNAMEYLGVQDFRYVGEGMDGMLSTIPNSKLTGMIDQLIKDLHPDEVYCGAYSEHCDHLALYTAMLGAARLKSGWMPKLFAIGTYPFSDQLYSTPEGGKIYLPLTEEMFRKKCKAFECYKSQMKPEPSPLGIAGLTTRATYDGMMCGSKYAELYYQLRYIRS